MGTTSVDNGAAISPSLAQAISVKALCLKIFMCSRTTGDDILYPVWGQAGLIRCERLTVSLPRQGDPVVTVREGHDRSSRFAVIPVTALHNVATGPGPDSDEVIEYAIAKIISPWCARRINDVAGPEFELAVYGVAVRKAIAVHVGGQMLPDQMANVAFKQVPECSLKQDLLQFLLPSLYFHPCTYMASYNIV